MRGLISAFLIFLLAAPLLAVEPARGAAGAERFAGSAFVDLDPWFVGDQWTYRTDTRMRFPNGTVVRATATITTTIGGAMDVTLNGTVYTVYNATTSGTASSNGQLYVPGLGALPYQVTANTAGYTWTDRSNLAGVRTNETLQGSGTVQFGIFTFPMTVDGATTVTFEPPEEQYDFPLETGDAWSYGSRVNATGFLHVNVQAPGGGDQWQNFSNNGTSQSSMWFNATQNATVPAGTFADAAWIHGRAASNSWTDRWFHGAAKNFVKFESHTVNAPNDYIHVWTNLTAFSLVTPWPWPGLIRLTPQRVDPGGSVVASGTANANEDLTVRIPATGASLTVRANASGGWSIPFAAPSVDDFTPANADVGSHGVLIEPVGAAGWDVETLQLILPDLSAIDADLAVSESAPLMGQRVTATGTVRESAAVGLSRPFTVTFAFDGVPFANYSVPSLAAGTGGSFTENYTVPPVPGPHMFTFTADPSDAIRELDEGNNTARRQITVRGPDLAPLNITIDADSSASYPDPALVGYVSAPVSGRLGGTVNVTFEAADVGSAPVNDTFSVTVVETLGLFGPPLGPGVVNATVAPPVPAGGRAGPWTGSWPVPAAPGTYYLNVSVDADGQVWEASEANNTFVVVVNVSGPDYALLPVVPPAKVSVGTAHPIDVAVRNEGEIAGDRDVLLAAYEGASATPFATATVPALGVGELRTFTVPWTAPASAGVVSLRFVVDPVDVLAEMLESNNEDTATVDVRDVPRTQISWSGPSVTVPSLFVTNATLFALAATDRSGTGITTWYRIDGAMPATYPGPFALSAEGPHLIAYWSVDNLGGTEAGQVQSVTVDDLPPATQLDAAAPLGDRRVITLTATDAGAGVARTEYRVDGAPNWTTYAGPFEVAGYGAHAVTFRSVDLLGHAEPEQTVPVSIPQSAPPSTNWKPAIAAAFAAVLLAVGLVRGRKERRLGLRNVRTRALLFAIAEGATGVASLGVSALAVPPLGAGLALDVGVLLGGLAILLMTGRPAEADEAGTPK